MRNVQSFKSFDLKIGKLKSKNSIFDKKNLFEIFFNNFEFQFFMEKSEKHIY